MTTQDALSAALQPPHGLILPGPVWGLDPSTLRLSACVLQARDGFPLGQFAWHTQSYSRAGAEQTQLARGLGELLRFFAKLRDDYGRPHGIYLEQPFAGSDKPNPKTGKVHRPPVVSYYYVALVLCALGHLFAEPEVQMIGPSTWKSKAMGTGQGFADKHEIFRWAQSVGYTGALQDEADAIGIATAGAVLLTS